MDEETQRLKDDVVILQIFLRANSAALLAYCDRIAGHLGITAIDGLSPAEWFKEHRARALEATLREGEDLDPGLAARAMSQIEEARSRGFG